MAQAVRRSPPTAGVPSSRPGHPMWVSWWTKRGLGRFFSGFLPFSPTTNFIPPFFSTLISFISFYFISPCDGASGVIGRHPCYSRTYNMGLHRSSSLDPTLCWTRVEDIYLFYIQKTSINSLHYFYINVLMSFFSIKRRKLNNGSLILIILYVLDA